MSVMRARLGGLRHGLLDLHRALADAERIALERVEGRLSNGAYLRRLLEDPALGWLLALSGLVVRIDEWLEQEDAVDGDGVILFAEMQRMLTPTETGDAFQRRYAVSLQENPDAVLAHGALMRSLRADG